MDRREAVVFTNMCMIRDGDRVVVQDRQDPRWSGITFPGGHVEPGEPFTDAVIRETREETGLTISHPRLCGVKDWYDKNGRYVVLLYIAEKYSGELHGSEEGPVFWVNLGDMPGMRMTPDMDRMLRVFLEDELSEFFIWDPDGDRREYLK